MSKKIEVDPYPGCYGQELPNNQKAVTGALEPAQAGNSAGIRDPLIRSTSGDAPLDSTAFPKIGPRFCERYDIAARVFAYSDLSTYEVAELLGADVLEAGKAEILQMLKYYRAEFEVCGEPRWRVDSSEGRAMIFRHTSHAATSYLMAMYRSEWVPSDPVHLRFLQYRAQYINYMPYLRFLRPHIDALSASEAIERLLKEAA